MRESSIELTPQAMKESSIELTPQARSESSIELTPQARKSSEIPKNQQTPESKLHVTEKIIELKQLASERATQIKNILNTMREKTKNWNDPEQLKIKQIFLQKVQPEMFALIENALDKNEGRILVDPIYYEEITRTLNKIDETITSVESKGENFAKNVLGDEELRKQLMRSCYPISGRFTFAEAGRTGTGYPLYSWEVYAKDT
jgi:hypothetical protein